MGHQGGALISRISVLTEEMLSLHYMETEHASIFRNPEISPSPETDLLASLSCTSQTQNCKKCISVDYGPPSLRNFVRPVLMS